MESMKHMYRVCPLDQLQQASYHENCIHLRAPRSEATLPLRQNDFPFAMVAEMTRHYFEEYFTGVRYVRDASIATTLRVPPFFLSSTMIVTFHCCCMPLPLHTPTMISQSIPPGCPGLHQSGSSGGV